MIGSRSCGILQSSAGSSVSAVLEPVVTAELSLLQFLFGELLASQIAFCSFGERTRIFMHQRMHYMDTVCEVIFSKTY